MKPYIEICMRLLMIYTHVCMKDSILRKHLLLYCYSMGSLIAYELAHKIKDLLGLNPHHIFFAAKQPPDYTSNNKILHTLPIPALVNELMAMGGTPSEIFQDPMLKEYFLPIIKSDLRITENYRYIRRESKLDCDFTIIDGIYDYMLKSPIGGWQNH
ncbi:thioesterase domain-containing protein [Paenibacillus sp. RRE4]|nr:thioesterase domain-containing protein [Paenibacillus sp. RRE4]MDT0125887.1 thioesterase domain-containing protein [Paenibacillus sp. RRE4]